MNETSRDEEPAGLDPDLVRLFEEARSDEFSGTRAAARDEAFVTALLTRVHRARRRRLLVRSLAVALIMVSGAALAPHVAQATLTVVGSLAFYPVMCVCAALIAWRTALRSN